MTPAAPTADDFYGPPPTLQTATPTADPPRDPPRRRDRRTRADADRRTRRTLAAFVAGPLAGIGNLSDMKVWLTLVTMAGGRTTVRTGYKRVADKCGVSEKTVSRSVRRLASTGVLSVVSKGGNGRGPTTYRIMPNVTNASIRNRDTGLSR